MEGTIPAPLILDRIQSCNPYPMQGNYYSLYGKTYRYDGTTWREHAGTTVHVGKTITRLLGESMDDLIARLSRPEKQ